MVYPSVELGEGGVCLTAGDQLLHHDYVLKVDRQPDHIKEKFLSTDDYTESEVTAESKTALNDVRRFVVDEIEHINSVSRRKGVDKNPEALEEERIDHLVCEDVLEMSSVWDEDWRGLKAGTCQERAITLHMVYEDFGISSEYHQGYISVEDGKVQHAWTTVHDYISDPSVSGEGLTSISDDVVESRYEERKIYVR
jgi:hypothetical protein